MACPLCSERRGYFWSLRRDTFLAVVFALLIVLFVVTGFAVRSYDAREVRLAWDWNKRGERDLEAGRPEAALVDFRNALFHARDNARYQLRLAQALAATGSNPQARTYLLSLRERDPGNGTVNLELARLAAREHAIPEASRYYHDAVYSEWEGDPVTKRRAVRLELVQFLLDSEQTEAARSELIAVAANLPSDADLRARVATLLVKVGGYDDALRLFRQALASQPHSAVALAGAGECYFQMGRYPEAARYLERAVQQDSHLVNAAAMLDTARAVQNLDPFARRLGEPESARRAQLDFGQALARLNACAAQRGISLPAPGDDPLQKLYAQAAALQPRARESVLGRDRDLLSNVMDQVFEIEQTTSQVCGAPQGIDLALLLIARQQEATRP